MNPFWRAASSFCAWQVRLWSAAYAWIVYRREVG